MDDVFGLVIPYINDRDDRNSVSLVCRRWYELDCLTRKHVTVHMFYSPAPSRVHERFPFIESLTLKGFPHQVKFPQKLELDITPWIQEIAGKFEYLKALHIRGVVIRDDDLELLARTRGKDLRELKIYHCEGFSKNGYMHICTHCNDLRVFCIEANVLVGEGNGKWLRELALRNTRIETLHFSTHFNHFDFKDLTLLAKNCGNSLVSLKVSPCNIVDLADALSHVDRLEDFDGGYIKDAEKYRNFRFPSTIRRLNIHNFPITLCPILRPLLNQLRELDLVGIAVKLDCQCFIIARCPNMEVLCTQDFCGDRGMQVIGHYCKKLRKLTYEFEPVTGRGLISVAQGCTRLEYLHVKLMDVSNEALECIGTNLKYLRDFRMDMEDDDEDFYDEDEDVDEDEDEEEEEGKGEGEVAAAEKVDTTRDIPLDNGIRAMLMGCRQLERLGIHLYTGDLSHMTDVGLRYVGEYGVNLRFLSLTRTGKSDEGLVALSKGCPKLRKLEIRNCPFSKQAIDTLLFNIHSLRYIWVHARRNDLALTRPMVSDEVVNGVFTIEPPSKDNDTNHGGQELGNAYKRHTN